MNRISLKPFRHGSFDQEKPSVRRNGTTTTAKNGRALLVIPVVQHSFEQIGISTYRYRLKEIASDELATISWERLGQIGLGALDDVRQIE
jgi:hypothetical protein